MKPNKLELNSVDGAQLNLEALYQIAPSCFTEVKDDKTGELRHVVNFNILRQLLGDNTVDDADEMYQFTWPGKQEARREAAKQTSKTLRPIIEDSKNWNNTENLYIEGDNLSVLKLLQQSYMNKVKMIYIDPPYNTGVDFIYNDTFSRTNFEEDLASGNVDEMGLRFRRNLDSNGKYHSNWCSMMYSRLLVARNLLSNDGIIFISIDDNEIRNIKCICDEIFGEKNFICSFVRKNKSGSGHDSKKIAVEFDYILCYAKEYDSLNVNFEPANLDNGQYKLEDEYVSERGKYYLRDLDYKGTYNVKGDYPIETPDKTIIYPGGFFGKPNTWRWSKEKFEWGKDNGYIVFKKNNNNQWKVYIKQYQYVDNTGNKYERTNPYTALIDFSNGQGTLECSKILGDKVFSFPKSSTLISHLLKIGSFKDSLVMDFFSGSASTAHAIMQLNLEDKGKRKFILVQLPEETSIDSEAYKAGFKNICEIGKERIRRIGEIIKKENANNPDIDKLDIGFRVFRLSDGNFEEIKKAPNEIEQSQLDLFVDNVKSDRNDLDLLFGAMLSWGVQLSLPMTNEEVDGKMIYAVNDGDLVACFADDITENIVKAMAAKQPLRVLFRDSCFGRDDTKINVFETLKQLLDWSEEEAMKNIKVI